jgi:hypothetical protein
MLNVFEYYSRCRSPKNGKREHVQNCKSDHQVTYTRGINEWGRYLAEHGLASLFIFGSEELFFGVRLVRQ